MNDEMTQAAVAKMWDAEAELEKCEAELSELRTVTEAQREALEMIDRAVHSFVLNKEDDQARLDLIASTVSAVLRKENEA